MGWGPALSTETRLPPACSRGTLACEVPGDAGRGRGSDLQARDSTGGGHLTSEDLSRSMSRVCHRRGRQARRLAGGSTGGKSEEADVNTVENPSTMY